MGIFNRKKNKTNSGQVETQVSVNRDTTSSSGPLFHQPRSSAFSRVFSPRSFKFPKKFPQGDNLTSRTSPVSIIDSNWPRHEESDVARGSSPEIEESDSFVDIATHHCGVASLPPMSPAMAAIEARTEEMFRSLRDHTSKPSSGDTSPPHKRQMSNGDVTENINMKKSSSTNASPDENNNYGGSAKPERKWTPRGLSTLISRRGGGNVTNQSSSQHSTDLSRNWLIDFNDLIIGKTIGHSSFGSVSQGKFNGTKVAVKTIQCESAEILSSFQKEAELNCKLRHPNIVLFMGICMQPTKICLVTELMVRGDVRELLSRSRNGRLRLDWPLRQQWALDTAQGMAYVHSLDPPMIHRDLKTNNLLVDRGMSVKICDFGLSRFRSDKLMSAVGTVQFSAPEVLRNEMYTESADLFSFGTVMWELYTKRCVFEGMSQINIYKAVTSGEMPIVDDECDERFRQLLATCWSVDPASRPSFREVIERLSVIVDELEDS